MVENSLECFQPAYNQALGAVNPANANAPAVSTPVELHSWRALSERNKACSYQPNGLVRGCYS